MVRRARRGSAWGHGLTRITRGRVLVAGIAIAATVATAALAQAGVTRSLRPTRRHVAAATTSSAAVTTSAPAGTAAPQPATAAVATPSLSSAGKIQHVVVIYQENHSFDETLGKFCQLHANRCDGYVGPVHLADGTTANMTQSDDIIPNVWHDVHAQTTAINSGAMDGWNNVYGCYGPQGFNCLTYYTPSQIPNLAALAAKYVVSDHTFSMYDSPSWGGHVYAAAATQDHFTGDIPTKVTGVVQGPGWGCDSKLVTPWIDPVTKKRSLVPSCIPARAGQLDPVQYPYKGAFRSTPAQYVPTIMDRLDAKQLSWKLYSTDTVWSICPSFAECEYGPQHVNLVPTTTFLTDAKAGALPSYSVLLPSGPGPDTSQHNGTSMLDGDNWIGQAVTALQKSPEWSSTAVFITYDDCGCFYDHVVPGLNPDGSPQGIRVPMVIVSPYAKVGYTDTHPASFASILRFTEETFGLSALSVNDAGAYDYANSFDFSAPVAGARATMTTSPISAASRSYTAAHPLDPDDPT
jgi:phospholipase C